jgi:2-polyprenyl-6-methoxyphenol hydroxylase-like FAD-dependent oxidoreductase
LNLAIADNYISDAAHPFLPHRGEGAAQAIEDGVSLGALLPRGTTVEDIRERLALYEKCRKERATNIQEASRLNSEPMDVQKRKGFSRKSTSIFDSRFL